MKSLQVTRTVIPSLSLGALDTAIRQVLAFARARRIGGGAVADIPHARRVLAEAFVDLLASEAVVRASARSIHAAPERLAVASAVAKYLVPVTTDTALRRLAVVLGARHYLRGSTFEKILRDHALVGLFDGSTVVNLSALGAELPRLAGSRGRSSPDEDALRARVASIYDLGAPLPAFRPEGLDVMARGADEGPAALALASREIEALSAEDVDPDVRRFVARAVAELSAERVARADAVLPSARCSAQPPELFEAAARHARLHAATAAVLVWLQNRAAFGGFFARGEWLAVALHRWLGPRVAPPPAAAWYEAVVRRLVDLADADAPLAFEGAPS